jgi:hypothetical protein
VPFAVRAIAQTHPELFALCRHVERSIQPIPDRELEAAVAAEVMRLVAVMQLMVRRADEPLAPARSERQPYRRVPQDPDQIEAEYERVETEELVEAHGCRRELVEGPRREPGHDDGYPRHHQQVDRVRAESGDEVERLRRVVDLVELPQHGHVVKQCVRDEAAEVVSNEKDDGEQDTRRDACGFASTLRRHGCPAERRID